MSETTAAELPPSWAWTTIGDVVYINPSWWATELEDEDHVPFVPMAAVEAESGRMDASARKRWKEAKKGFTRFQEQDVLFAKITPSMENGKFAVATNLPSGIGVGSTEFHVLRPIAEVDPKYLLFFLLRQQFRQAARISMKGAAGQLRVPPEFLSQTALPLPPSAEQHRIVAEIEKHFTRLDAAVAELQRVQAKLKHYRTEILQAACDGRLVPTEAELAQAEGREYESADELLNRILKARREQWEADQLAKMEAAGKPPQDDKWKAKYKEPIEPDTSELPDLPEGWRWALTQQIGQVQLGRQRSPQNRPKDYPTKYIRAANITEKGLDLSDVLEMEFTPDEQERFRLHYGDLVLSEASGSIKQVGKPAIWRDELPNCCFQNTVIRLRPVEVSSEYLLVVFQHYYFNGHFAKIAGGVGINHLSADKFSNIAVPLPPLAEQLRIVAEVSRQLSIVDDFEKNIEASLKRAEVLRQQVLENAFAGKLVVQDPNDEPASILLEKIKAERLQREAEEQAKRKGERKAVKKTTQKTTGERRKIIDVLRQAERALTPEELFREAGFKPEEVEEFYAELKTEEQAFTQDKQPSGDVYLTAIA